ncbi:MAG: hypothetical protein ACRCSG_08875 [Cellulosilyticaceae bacterium]
MLETILVVTVAIVGLTTAIVQLVTAIAEFNKEQKNNLYKLCSAEKLLIK